MSVPHWKGKMKTKEPLAIRRKISIWSIWERKETAKSFYCNLMRHCLENFLLLASLAIYRMWFNLTLYNDELMLHTFMYVMSFIRDFFLRFDALRRKLNVLNNKCDYSWMLKVDFKIEKKLRMLAINFKFIQFLTSRHVKCRRVLL